LETDVEPTDIHSLDDTDVKTDYVGSPVGITDSGDATIAAEGDGALSSGEALKDRHNSSIGPQWGEGRTTWHPNDIYSEPVDHDSLAAIEVLETERRKEEVRRLFGDGSWLKRVTDGTVDDLDGDRHEKDVQLRITAFCEQLDFHAYEQQVASVYDCLPPEPFQPIGGHESAGCQAPRPVTVLITDVHPPANGDPTPPPNSEYSWDLEFTKVKHNPSTCPHCDQCRCGRYHLGDPPKNGVETQILAAMRLVDEHRIQAADDPQAAYNSRLGQRDGYDDLVTRHALKPIQTLRTTHKHYDTDEG